MNESTNWLHGVIPPLITPLLEDGALDLAGLERLVERQVAGGVQGLFLLGTTGEGPSLSYQLRYRLVERVCEIVAGRLPVLVGVTDTSLVEAVDLANHAFGAGAAAAVSAAPYYLPISQSQLFGFIAELAEQSPLPLVLYNMPGCTKTAFELDTIERCRQLPSVIGVKDSSGDMQYFQRLCDRYADDPSFAVLVGPEERLAEAVAMGADGGVCGGGNIFPQLYSQLYSAAVHRDGRRVAELQTLVQEIFDTVYRVGPYHPNCIIQGVKSALRALDVCSSLTAPPIDQLNERQHEQVREYIQALAPRIETLVAAH